MANFIYSLLMVFSSRKRSNIISMNKPDDYVAHSTTGKQYAIKAYYICYLNAYSELMILTRNYSEYD